MKIIPRYTAEPSLVAYDDVFVVVPMAITDLHRRFIVATREGKECAVVSVSVLQTLDMSPREVDKLIHSQVEAIVAAERAMS